MIVNDDSRVVIMMTLDSNVIRMMLQVVTSHMIIILMTLEGSFMLPENIYSPGITHDNHHHDYHDDRNISIVQATKGKFPTPMLKLQL